jgi:predicted nucleic acid-binding protein
MKRRVLLDANMLIGVFDGDGKNSAHVRAQGDFEALASDPEVEFVITPLVRYEFLRGVRRAGVAETETALLEMTATLNDFKEIEIRQSIGDRAAELFRLAKNKGVDLDKRSFDLIHCVCAEVYGLELVSQDAHIQKIQQMIQGGRSNV